MNKQDIIARIQTAFPDAEVSVSGENCGLTLRVVDDVFIGKSRVQRQQMVSSLLKKEFQSGVIHALTIVAKSREEI